MKWSYLILKVLKKFNFKNSYSDNCVYNGSVNKTKGYLLSYVNDGLIASKVKRGLLEITNTLKDNFEMKTSQNFVELLIEKLGEGIFFTNKNTLKSYFKN